MPREAWELAPLSEYFPKRPINLRLHLISWRVALLGMLLGLGCASFSILALRASVPNFRDELRLNGTWVPSSRVVRMGGGDLHHDHPTVAIECEYTINYAIDNPSAPGRTGFKRLDYEGLFKGVDESIPLEVYYNSTAPDRVSTNWGVAMLLPYRMLWQGVAQLFMLPLVVLLLLKSFSLPRKMRDIWAAGRESTPIAVKQFWLDAGHKTMLALISPKGNAYLLDAEIWVLLI